VSLDSIRIAWENRAEVEPPAPRLSSEPLSFKKMWGKYVNGQFQGVHFDLLIAIYTSQLVLPPGRVF
jgi:hypothetical protein